MGYQGKVLLAIFNYDNLIQQKLLELRLMDEDDQSLSVTLDLGDLPNSGVFTLQLYRPILD